MPLRPAALVVALFPATASAQVPCQDIRFAAGASSGTITGQVLAGTYLCFTLEVGEGQQAEVSVESLGPEVMIVSILGVGDARESFAWATRAGTYEIRVMPLFRSRATSDFRLHTAVTSD